MIIKDWIACADRLPEKNMTVILKTGDDEIPGQYRESRQCMLGSRAGYYGPGFIDSENHLPLDGVSHWKPLPPSERAL